MDKKKSIIWGVVFTIIFILGLTRLYSLYLDKNAEIKVDKMYPRDKKGIVQGMQSISIKKGEEKAILMIHGFGDSPAIFSNLIQDMQTTYSSDIYAPLLPFNGRNLQELSKSNNEDLLRYIDTNIHSLTNEYKEVTVVGMSYGGALLAKLAYENKVPENVKLVFYSPAFYIKSNSFLGRNVAKLYSYWRDYCDYKVLGCGSPNYASGDISARAKLTEEKSFKYVDVPALLSMYKFDLNNRIELGKIKRPYSIIMAVDDNRVSYKDIKDSCDNNQKYCKLYSFSSGKHLLHLGENQKPFTNLLRQLHA